MDLAPPGEPAPPTSLDDLSAELLNNVLGYVFDPAAAETVDKMGVRKYKFDMSILRVNKALHKIAKTFFDKQLDWVHFTLNVPQRPGDPNEVPVFYLKRRDASPAALLGITVKTPSPLNEFGSEEFYRHRNTLYILGRDLPAFVQYLRCYDLLFSNHKDKAPERKYTYYEIDEDGEEWPFTPGEDEFYEDDELDGYDELDDYDGLPGKGLHCWIKIKKWALPERYSPLLGQFGRLHGLNNECNIQNGENKDLEKAITSSIRKANPYHEVVWEGIDRCMQLVSRANKFSAPYLDVQTHDFYGFTLQLLTQRGFIGDRLTRPANVKSDIWKWYKRMQENVERLLTVNRMIAEYQASKISSDRSFEDSSRFIRRFWDELRDISPDNRTTTRILELQHDLPSYLELTIPGDDDDDDDSFQQLDLSIRGKHFCKTAVNKLLHLVKNPGFGPFHFIIGEEDIPLAVRDKYIEYLAPVPTEEESTLMAWKAPWIDDINGTPYYIG